MKIHYSSTTPLRVSLLGGGSDFSKFISIRERYVVGMAINFHININAYRMPQIFPNRIRVQYSKVEEVEDVENIKHNAIREILKFKKLNGINLSIASDMPSGCGLGSSSAFTCGMISIINRIQDKIYTPFQIANEAIHIEQNILKENVGYQDQIFSALGGFKIIKLDNLGFYDYTNIVNYDEIQPYIEENSFLIFTGELRQSSAIQSKNVKNPLYDQINESISDIADNFVKKVNKSNNKYRFLEESLRESWKLKSSICEMHNNKKFNNLIDKIESLGCSSYKLCGAGGGGFIFCLVDKNKQENFYNAFDKNTIFRVSPCPQGSLSYSIDR